MARKKKKKVNKFKLQFKKKERKWQNIFGVFFMFLSIILLISLVSYLFTWQSDQDKVLKFTWSQLLFSDVEVSNWLGRLGASISSLMFYWGVGIASMTMVYVFFKTGFFMIKRKPFKAYFDLFLNAILFIAVSSVALNYMFRSSTFPWGGNFGQSINNWLVSFLGNLGLICLIVFALAALMIWYLDPDLEDIKALGYWKALYRKLPGVQGMNLSIPGFGPLSAEEMPKKKSKISKPVTLRPSNEGEGEEESDDNLLTFKIDESLVEKLKKRGRQSADPELEINIDENQSITENSETRSEKINYLNDKRDDKEKFEMEMEEEDLGPYDPTLDLSNYAYPPLEILNIYEDKDLEIDKSELIDKKDQIIKTLLNYKIEITHIKATVGPTVTLYEIVPAPGVRISKIKNLEDDIALSLAALGIRIIAPMPGKGTIGIEVPNKKKQIVSLRTVLKSPKFAETKMDLPVALGKTISNEVFVADLAKMPHLLIAGATGQGKSVGINAVLISLLYKKHPSQVKFVLIDPKKVELPIYNDIVNHFLGYLPGQEEAIITETSKVIHTLNSLCIEMDQRYDLLKAARVRNIKEYNTKFTDRQLNPNKGHKYLPYIVLVIDEFADLIMTAGKEVEMPIARLAQLARAVGIHLVIATQRPSVNIITGIIKANFPARIAFKVTSKIDSRTILDSGGADQLIGRGDMLLSVGGKVIRLQCAFVDTPEVEKVISHIAAQQSYPTAFLLPEFTVDEGLPNSGINVNDLDEMFEEAARLVVSQQHGSTSMIQRRLKLGYNRAGRIMDQLEELGIVGPSEGSKAREVLVFSEMELDHLLTELAKRK